MKKNSIPKLELVFLLLLTGMCPQAHATDDGRNASPQKTYAVDLTLGSATVLTFTEAVTSQTGVLFSYESALSQMPLGDVSVHETAAPLEHILEKVFKGRGFRYKVVDRIVVLTYDTDSARSQLVLVTGRVKDGSGMPLVGASVVVKDTMRGVSAGAEGNYRIFADPDATLVFSYIGYADREERIGTRSAIDVVLEEYEAVLEDVVVVGYGTQSRRTVTAAISKFDGHLLEGIPVNSVGDALKGRVPGVRVATTDATPGADPKFLIRGGSSINQSNDPIVLVDGVVREMAGLNPNDIESVSFLKDAAAAGIYGSRASNGVILITTKKGSKHLGPRIVFEGQWAWASPATKFDLMNARDYILTVRPALMEGYCGGMDPASVLGGEQSAGTGNTAKSLWTTRYLRPDEPVPAGYQWVEDPVNPGRIIVFEDNDQQSQWFGDACWQNYYVGIDGGGDNIQYAASAGYTDDSGIGITTGYSRFTFHGNTTFQVTRRLRASTTFDYSQIEQQTFESAPLSLRNSVIRGLSVPNTHRDWYGEEAGEELAGTPALALDYYNKETRDLLFDVSLPNTTGYNSVSTNLGRVRFYGTELSLSSVNIDRKGFSWRTDFTYSYNMNRVLELPDNGNPRNRINGISVGDGSQFGGIAEGERMGRIFGYVAERIIETQEEADAARYDTQSRGYRRSDRRQIAGRKDIGDYEWKDRPGSTRMDGRQIINAEDQFLLGYALPHSTGGIGNTFRYRNWTLNVYMDYALGHSVRNDMQMRYFQSTMGNCNYNLVNEVKKCWSQPGDDTRYARFTANDTDWGNRNYGRTSDIFVEKADYLCLRDVSLSWSLPKAWLRKLHISDVTLTVSGNTLCYWTAVHGVSPEAATTGGLYTASSTYDTGFSPYPPTRKVLFTAKLTF